MAHFDAENHHGYPRGDDGGCVNGCEGWSYMGDAPTAADPDCPKGYCFGCCLEECDEAGVHPCPFDAVRV